jgi:hypothetical protein
LLHQSDAANAQDSLGVGIVEYADPEYAVVSGVVDDPSLTNATLMYEATDEFGGIQVATLEVDSDGSFLLFASPEFIAGSTSTMAGTLYDPATGAVAGNLFVVANIPFDLWFDQWTKNPSGRVVPLPGRPCLYDYQNLQENYNDIDLDFGDYLPKWPNADYLEEENLHYIKVLVEGGDPIKDTFVDDDGLPIDRDPDVDSTLDKERKIIEDEGYIWDETIPGWRVPDGYVWDEEEKKWVPA